MEIDAIMTIRKAAMKQTSNFARGGETADLSARIRTNTPPPPRNIA